jgi:hypothetical protein
LRRKGWRETKDEGRREKKKKKGKRANWTGQHVALLNTNVGTNRGGLACRDRSGLYSRWRRIDGEPHLARVVHSLRPEGTFMKLIGIVLIVFGVLGLALGGFSYTTRERVVDLGPLKVDADKEHSLPVAPIAGVVAVIAGVALVVVGGKSRIGG